MLLWQIIDIWVRVESQDEQIHNENEASFSLPKLEPESLHELDIK